MPNDPVAGSQGGSPAVEEADLVEKIRAYFSRPAVQAAMKVLLGTASSAAILVVLVWGITTVKLDDDAALLLAIITGGLLGGFTLSLIGGEQFGVRFPGKDPKDRFDPGFLGDTFVGIMAALVVFGLGTGIGNLAPLTAPHGKTLLSAGLTNFATAYVAGFLGINLIRSLSKQFLENAKIKDQLADAQQTKLDTDFLMGLQAMDAKQYQTAEMLMRKAIEAEKNTTIRAYIGLAQVIWRIGGRGGEAISTVSDALRNQAIEKEPSRVATAYFNRACYVAAMMDSANPQIKPVIEDLAACFKLAPSWPADVRADADFAKAWKVQEFIDYMAALGVSQP